MIHIVTALAAESGPLVEHFGLKRDYAYKGHDRFSNGDLSLVVSGLGKIKAAIAVTRALENDPHRESSCLINIGICGASAAHGVGEIYWAHKITDNASKRRYYPDNIIRHDLKEAVLETHDIPVLQSNGETPQCLVDMEASGIFEAASHFLPTSHIGILKIVSDHFAPFDDASNHINKLMSSNMASIARCVESFRAFAETKYSPLPEQDLAMLLLIKERLRLSASQYAKLLDVAHGASINGKNRIQELRQFSEIEPSSKFEGKRIFEQVTELLTAR